MKINVVIPMAGAGSRFTQAGYTKPKPFIDVIGMPMIQHVLKNIYVEGMHFILIAQQRHIEQESQTVTTLSQKYPITWIPIEKQTEGATCTVLYSHREINNSTPLLIANSDQIVDMDFNAYIQDMVARQLDGSIVTFYANDPKWSYAKLNEKNLVTEVKEKECISSFATAGIYLFKEGKIFVDSAIDMITRNERVNNEFYVAPTYNQAIKRGKNFGIYPIDASLMHGTGTPQDLDLYLKFLER